MLAYPIDLQKDGDTVLATSPDFPELTTFGDDRDEALLHALDALEEAIAARIANRKAIPRPSRGMARVALPTQTAIKVQLYQAMLDRGLRKADLARALDWRAPQVDRLFNLRHASRLDQLDAAFGAMGLTLQVDVETPKGRRVVAKRPRTPSRARKSAASL